MSWNKMKHKQEPAFFLPWQLLPLIPWVRVEQHHSPSGLLRLQLADIVSQWTENIWTPLTKTLKTCVGSTKNLPLPANYWQPEKLTTASVVRGSMCQCIQLWLYNIMELNSSLIQRNKQYHSFHVSLQCIFLCLTEHICVSVSCSHIQNYELCLCEIQPKFNITYV